MRSYSFKMWFSLPLGFGMPIPGGPITTSQWVAEAPYERSKTRSYQPTGTKHIDVMVGEARFW